MMRKFAFFLLPLFFLYLGCSQNKQVYAEIVKLEKVGSMLVDFKINDLAYTPESKMIYIAEEYKDFIWIYHNFDFQNKIGGKGNSNRNFQLLTDIEVSENGNLLALDNLQKRVSIFDKDGIYRNSFSLKDYANPTKFTLASDDLMYFYDRDQQEIVLLNLLTNQEFIRFGKFEISLPKALRFVNNMLVITTENYQTDLYNSLGTFVVNYQHLALRDNYQNTIALHNNFIFVNGQAISALILQGSPIGMLLKGKSLLIYSKNELIIYNLKYNFYN